MRGVEPAYANHVRRLYGDEADLQRLFAAGEAVHNATRQPGWSIVMDLISAEREDIRGKLEGPKTLETAEVQHLLGQLRGLSAAESAAQALLELHRVTLEQQSRKHEVAGESAAER